MSVLIKGMEMPKECRDCPLEMYYMNIGEIRCRAENKILAENFKTIPFDGRPEWCPLVEVPTPHGRLIDADALDYKLGASDVDIYVRCTLEEDAPTVIEAEETVMRNDQP